MRIKKISVCAIAILLMLSLLTACKEESTENGETAAKHYTVTFVSGGGTEISPKLVKEGTPVDAPDAPEKEGYVFGGWYNGNYEWTFNTAVHEDMTLIAKWISPEEVYKHEPTGDGETTVITGTLQRANIMRLPSQIGGYNVTGIGDGAFKGVSSEQVSRIVIPESIVSVGDDAFGGCAGIEIIVEGKLTRVGERAFSECDGLAAVGFGEGLETVSMEAFASTGLRSVTLPKTLKTIDENAFDNCSSLEIVFIHDGVEAINDSAFFDTAVVAVYFYGEEANIAELLENRVFSRNDALTEARIYLYSETAPSVDTEFYGFWYFDENNKVKLWK